MSFLRKLFGREEEDVEVAPIKLDVGTVVGGSNCSGWSRPSMHSPPRCGPSRAWTIRAGVPRVNEYSRLAGDAADERRAPTREGILDLVFEVRPVFSGEVPAGMEPLVPLQTEVLAAAEALRDVLPGEKG